MCETMLQSVGLFPRNAGLPVHPLRAGAIFLSTQLAKQPRLSHLPIALNCLRRNFHDLRGFRNTQSAEITQLHHAAFASIHPGQRGQCLIQGEYFDSAGLRAKKDLVQRHSDLGGLSILRENREADLEPFWQDESDLLCTVEFLRADDPEARLFAPDIIGYLCGYAHLTNIRSLAIIGDPDASAYELLFSFACPSPKLHLLEIGPSVTLLHLGTIGERWWLWSGIFLIRKAPRGVEF
jgi:hypothetical protein